MLARRVRALADLELHAAVARHGSMKGAATQLGLTQQAVSLRIRSMERLVGMPLLLRSRNGSELTSAARLLNQWASGLLTEAEQLAVALASSRTDRDARLRIAASLTIAEHPTQGGLMQRGEVWWVDFDERRPVLLLSDEEPSGFQAIQVVAPASTDITGVASEVTVGNVEGLPFEGVVRVALPRPDLVPCTWLMTLSRSDLLEPAGALPLAKLERITDLLHLAGLD